MIRQEKKKLPKDEQYFFKQMTLFLLKNIIESFMQCIPLRKKKYLFNILQAFKEVAKIETKMAEIEEKVKAQTQLLINQRIEDQKGK
jgi:hypothetical protein